MKTTIQIKEIAQKTGKTGKAYTSLKTDQNGMSCFDAKVSEELQKYLGKSVIVEVIEKNNFKNITAFYSVNNDDTLTVTREDVKDEPVFADRYEQARKSKDVMMQLSYAKDIFCAIIDKENENYIDTMEKAVDLIQQAKEALEK